MNAMYFAQNRVVVVLFLMIFAISCKSQNTNTPYKKGKVFVFKVTVSDSNLTEIKSDTLSLEIKNKGLVGILFGMNMAQWESRGLPENKQKRGVNIKSDFVEMQMPIGFNYLENENIAMAGYPSFSETMLIGYSTESEHYFVKGYGKLSGEKIKQHRVVVDSTQIRYKNKTVNCKVSEGGNRSAIDKYGTYKLKSFYNKDLGFVKMIYNYPNGKIIVFDLIGIEEKL